MALVARDFPVSHRLALLIDHSTARPRRSNTIATIDWLTAQVACPDDEIKIELS